MESILLFNLVGILRESLVILLKTRNLIASISLFILLFNSVLALCLFFSIKPLTIDFVTNGNLLFMTSPGNSLHANIITYLKSDLGTILSFQWLFIFALSIASLFSLVTTILASANSYQEQNSSLKDLLSQAIKSSKVTIVTWFYVIIFDVGYLYFATFTLLPFILIFSNPFGLTPLNFVLMMIVLVFHVYITVNWNLSLVISVIEEKCGFEALGRAAKLVKGMKLEGFLLNALFGALTLIVPAFWNMANIKSTASTLFIGLLILNFSCLIKISALIAFTVFYYKCKQSHGEDIDLGVNLEYSKVPNPLLAP